MTYFKSKHDGIYIGVDSDGTVRGFISYQTIKDRGELDRISDEHI